MQVPVEVIPLNKWSAYNAPLPENSEKSHTVIIVYRTETDIKYFYVTSQVEKAVLRYRDDKDALVEIEQSEWSEVLKVKSCIQCGNKHLNCIDINKFKGLYERGEIHFLGDLPKTITTRVKQSINSSITYTLVEQSILTNEK
jgi:hypothetical protein